MYTFLQWGPKGDELNIYYIYINVYVLMCVLNRDHKRDVGLFNPMDTSFPSIHVKHSSQTPFVQSVDISTFPGEKECAQNT